MRGKRIGHAKKKYSLVKGLTNRARHLLHRKPEKLLS
jgi:hypothetical protein